MRSVVARGVVVRRNGLQVLDGVSLTADAGDLLAVVGPSGSGKTTLLSTLAGTVRPDAGLVTLDGEPVTGAIEQRRRLGFVLQAHALLPVLTAGENVEVALRARGVAPAAARDRARETLDRVGLAAQQDRLVEQLSGGQQQRVALARALAPRPELLVADEPTSELDTLTRDGIVTLLEAEARRGVIVVVATHDEEVASRCTRRVELLDGRRVGVPPA